MRDHPQNGTGSGTLGVMDLQGARRRPRKITGIGVFLLIIGVLVLVGGLASGGNSGAGIAGGFMAVIGAAMLASGLMTGD